MRNLTRSNTGRRIGIILVPVVVLAMAAKPSFADYFGNSDRAILDAGGTISRVAPNWRIVCFGEGGDVFGGVSRHKHCRIEKSDFHAIAVITSERLSIPYRPSRPACKIYSGRMRVDGKPIGKLPRKAQIVAMSHGTTLSRPYQTPWPECRRFTEFTDLYGFSAALSRLKVRWRKFK